MSESPVTSVDSDPEVDPQRASTPPIPREQEAEPAPPQDTNIPSLRRENAINLGHFFAHEE